MKIKWREISGSRQNLFCLNKIPTSSSVESPPESSPSQSPSTPTFVSQKTNTRDSMSLLFHLWTFDDNSESVIREMVPLEFSYSCVVHRSPPKDNHVFGRVNVVTSRVPRDHLFVAIPRCFTTHRVSSPPNLVGEVGWHNRLTPIDRQSINSNLHQWRFRRRFIL